MIILNLYSFIRLNRIFLGDDAFSTGADIMLIFLLFLFFNIKCSDILGIFLHLIILFFLETIFLLNFTILIYLIFLILKKELV